MAKKESTIVNMVLTLFIVTAVAAGGLGLIYQITKEPIEIAKKQKVENALKEILPEFDNIEVKEVDPGFESKPSIFKLEGVKSDQFKIYTATKGGKYVGTAVEAFTMKGFSGKISVIVGFDPEGKIKGYKVLEHAETPGLGDKMQPWFEDKIIDEIVPEGGYIVKNDGGTIDAITAATISSRAFLDAVNNANNKFQEEILTIEEGNEDEKAIEETEDNEIDNKEIAEKKNDSDNSELDKEEVDNESKEEDINSEDTKEDTEEANINEEENKNNQEG
jgi:electron transport complex protein RnfG